jgi:hypothetical protein
MLGLPVDLFFARVDGFAMFSARVCFAGSRPAFNSTQQAAVSAISDCVCCCAAQHNYDEHCRRVVCHSA